MNIISSKPVPVSFVKETLTERKGEGELGYEQAQALEHAEKFSTMPESKMEKLMEELKGVNVPDETAIKIIDVAPQHAATLRAILIKDKVELDEAQVDGILKLLK